MPKKRKSKRRAYWTRWQCFWLWVSAVLMDFAMWIGIRAMRSKQP